MCQASCGVVGGGAARQASYGFKVWRSRGRTKSKRSSDGGASFGLVSVRASEPCGSE